MVAIGAAAVHHIVERVRELLLRPVLNRFYTNALEFLQDVCVEDAFQG